MEMMALKALHVLDRAQACLIIRDFSLCQWDNFAWKGHLDYDVTACQLKVIQIKVLFFSSIIKTLGNCLNGLCNIGLLF